MIVKIYRSIIYILCLSFILLSLCACQSTQFNGATGSSSIPLTPGTLTDPNLIPKANTSDLNQTVTISFRDLWEQEQFVRPSATIEPEDHSFAFVYIYNSKNNTSRLVALNEDPEDESICVLTVYEPSWDGGESLCNAIISEFDAVIIDRINITYQERRYMDAAVSFDSNYVSANEIVDVESFIDQFQDACVQFYFGEVRLRTEETEDYWHPINSELKIAIKANTREHASPEFEKTLNIFLRIVSRFNLEEKLGID